MSREFGKGLKSVYGWRKGDVVALFSKNHIDLSPIIFGTLWAGGVISPANPGYTASELATQLRDNEARLIITEADALETVRDALRMIGRDDDSIVLLGDDSDPSGRMKHWTNIRNISGAQRYRQTNVDPMRDLAFLVYSSGTTGKPKGVQLSHYNLTSNVLQIQPSEQFNLTWDGSKTSGDIPLPPQGSGSDKILACLPFFHIYGLTMFVLSPMYTGVTTFVMSRFEIDRWCFLVQKHRITYSYLVPPIVLLLAKHPSVSSYDLSSIRMTNSGAAPLTRELVEAVHKRTGIRVKQGYGLSETSPGAFHQLWDHWLSAVGSVGWLLPNMEAKFCRSTEADEASLSDHDAEEVGPEHIGELYLRGPNIFSGYHKNPSATSQCLSKDGWFRTGDIGHVDKSGNMFITDRAKELIKYKGFQVSPAELEGFLCEHPLVYDCAVVGVYADIQATEFPMAYVVRDGSGSRTAKARDAMDIIEWFNKRVSSHKRLRGGVVFVPEIPKNASGKILRRVLKDRARQDYLQSQGATSLFKL
jgi:4-coumarate--CoA ligase